MGQGLRRALMLSAPREVDWKRWQDSDDEEEGKQWNLDGREQGKRWTLKRRGLGDMNFGDMGADECAKSA